MALIGYARVSTDAQERDGTSLDTQVRACAEYAASAGWSVVATVRDSASGFSLERPGMTLVRDGFRLGEFDVVLAYAVDRLSRHQNHIGVLFDEAEGWGVRFEFVTERFEDTAIGRFILAARAFTAEVEREKIAERTMRGKAERARAGKPPQATGKGIYGCGYDPSTGRREGSDEQAAVVRRAFEHGAMRLAPNAIASRRVPVCSSIRRYARAARSAINPTVPSTRSCWSSGTQTSASNAMRSSQDPFPAPGPARFTSG